MCITHNRTKGEIAYEKISALKSGMLCISTIHTNAIKKVFDDYAKSINTKINYVNHTKKNRHIKLNGTHQLENEALAIDTVKSLNNFNINENDIHIGLSSVNWPGRIQKIHTQPNVYFDVAHNYSSFISLCNFSTTLKGPKILILALQKHKIINKAINRIEKIFDKIVITQTNIRNYYPAEKLSDLFTKRERAVFSDPQKAIKLYRSYSLNSNIIIAGSHYLGPFISKEFKISFDNI